MNSSRCYGHVLRNDKNKRLKMVGHHALTSVSFSDMTASTSHYSSPAFLKAHLVTSIGTLSSAYEVFNWTNVTTRAKLTVCFFSTATPSFCRNCSNNLPHQFVPTLQCPGVFFRLRTSINSVVFWKHHVCLFNRNVCHNSTSWQVGGVNNGKLGSAMCCHQDSKTNNSVV